MSSRWHNISAIFNVLHLFSTMFMHVKTNKWIQKESKNYGWIQAGTFQQVCTWSLSKWSDAALQINVKHVMSRVILARTSSGHRFRLSYFVRLEVKTIKKRKLIDSHNSNHINNIYNDSNCLCGDSVYEKFSTCFTSVVNSSRTSK